MRNLKQNKLSLKKFQIAKINDAKFIYGGDEGPLTPTTRPTRPTIPTGPIDIEDGE